MVGPTAQQTRCFAWLRDHLPEDGTVQLSDVTSMYTALNVIGPKAGELLSELTDTPLGTQDFMHMTCKVGWQSIFFFRSFAFLGEMSIVALNDCRLVHLSFHIYASLFSITNAAN